MSTVPAYLAATAGRSARAGQVNQFLGAHTSQFVYAGGTVQSSQATGAGVYSDTLTQWLTQRFTTGVSQTAIGSIQLQLSTIGGSPTLPLIAALQVGLYADSGGLPSGAALASATVSGTYVYSSPFWVTVPLVATGLSPGGPYHVVTAIAGTTGHYYAWQRSNQATGAASSPDGVTWTNQTYGLMYQVYDQSGTGLLQLISDDSGAHVTTFTYDSLNRISQVAEYTTAQDGTSIQSSGTLSYSNGLMTGVS
jgi:hypothetical protein